MFIFTYIWIITRSFLWLLSLALIVGLFRVFVLGARKRYPNPLTDISVLKKGDIVLTGKQEVTHSAAIQLSNVLTRKIKHRFWTHAAIYRGDGMLWEAQPRGIIERDINDYFEAGHIMRAFRHKYIKDEKILDKALDYCARQEGRPYGFLGLGFFVVSSFMPISFNFLFTNPVVDKWCKMEKAYFCSELIVEAFEDIGYPVSPYDGWRVKPSDFISNPLLEEV
jgi:uncharacterized protein YycO